MALETLHDVLVDQLKDLLNAEKQIVRALPRMIKTVSHNELKNALEEHLEVTEGQIDRIEKVFESIGVPAKGKKCKGMEGLIEEAEETIEHKKGSSPSALDAGIIVGAQKVEHYEICGYGSARAFAEELGYEEAADLLQETLDEERQADERLNDLAKTINQEATTGEEEEEEEGEELMSSGARGSGLRGSARRRSMKSMSGRSRS